MRSISHGARTRPTATWPSRGTASATSCFPLLREFNPAIADVLARTAEQADEVFADLEQDVAAALRDAELPRAGKVLIFDAAKLAALSERLLRELFNVIWECAKAGPQRHDPRALATGSGGCAQGKAKARDLPGGLRIGSDAASSPRRHAIQRWLPS